jgi:hypothetical protein
MRSRTDKQTASFLNTGFEFKGISYKALTAQTLLILERVKSPFFTGEDAGVRGLLDYLFATSQETRVLLPLARSKDDWEMSVLEFAEQFTADDLEELGQIVSEASEEIASAVVEAKPQTAKGSKK